MSQSHLVVVGGSLAGLRSVESARRQGYTGPLTLVGAEEHLPYDRPPLSKGHLEVTGERPLPKYFRSESFLTDELDVDVRLGVAATALDTDARVVTVGGERLRYSSLIIATGAHPRTLDGGEDVGGVHTLRTVDDAENIRQALEGGARTVVIGAGFIGSEVASSARKRGGEVAVVEAMPVPMARSVGEVIGRACAKLHRDNGTDLRCGVKVTGLEQSHGRVSGVKLDDGSLVDADLVVVGVGVSPATGWLAGSGVTLHHRDGGVVCDETLWAGTPGVYCAGDVAHWPNPLFDGEMMRLEHWTNAAEQGVLAAKNAVGIDPPASLAAVPYFWSDLYGSRVQFVGVPQAEEVRTVNDDGRSLLALYRRGSRLTGLAAINRPTEVMKFRRLIADRISWGDALELAGAGG